jgi:hypothetical protein
MWVLGDYITGRGGEPSKKELSRLVDRYEWFTTARRTRALVTGDSGDVSLVLPLQFWSTVPPVFAPQSVRPPAVRVVEPAGGGRHADLIDRFIEHGGHRIDPATETTEAKVDVDIDPEMVTAELAEIYRSQGLHAEAEKIYRILNLRNS